MGSKGGRQTCRLFSKSEIGRTAKQPALRSCAKAQGRASQKTAVHYKMFPAGAACGLLLKGVISNSMPKIVRTLRHCYPKRSVFEKQVTNNKGVRRRGGRHRNQPTSQKPTQRPPPNRCNASLPNATRHHPHNALRLSANSQSGRRTESIRTGTQRK